MRRPGVRSPCRPPLHRAIHSFHSPPWSPPRRRCYVYLDRSPRRWCARRRGRCALFDSSRVGVHSDELTQDGFGVAESDVREVEPHSLSAKVQAKKSAAHGQFIRESALIKFIGDDLGPNSGDFMARSRYGGCCFLSTGIFVSSPNTILFVVVACLLVSESTARGSALQRAPTHAAATSAHMEQAEVIASQPTSGPAPAVTETVREWTGSSTAVAITEPAALMLLGSGLLGAVVGARWVQRRRRLMRAKRALHAPPRPASDEVGVMSASWLERSRSPP